MCANVHLTSHFGHVSGVFSSIQIIDGKKLGVEIILDDPAGNSFIQVM